jgi:pilus assembly protein CpaE
VIGLLKTMFTYIVVDTESVFDDRTTTAIEMSDMILLTCIMSLPGIKNIQRYLNYFSKLGFGRDRVKLVVNRYMKKGNIKIGDAEKVLNYPIFYSVPNDYDSAMACLNKGEPLNRCAPKSDLNDSIKEMARILTGVKATEG